MVDIWWDCFMCPCCGKERPKRRRQTRLGRSRDWIDMDWLIFVHQETWAGISTETFGERVTSQLLANSNRTFFAVAEYRVAYCSTRPGHFPNIAWPLSCAFVSQEVAGVAQSLFKCRYCLTKGRWFLDVLSYCKVIISFPDLLPLFDALYLRSTCAVTGGCFASSASKGCGRGCHASRRTTKTATAGGFTRWMHQKSQGISLDPLIHALHDVAWCEKVCDEDIQGSGHSKNYFWILLDFWIRMCPAFSSCSCFVLSFFSTNPDHPTLLGSCKEAARSSEAPGRRAKTVAGLWENCHETHLEMSNREGLRMFKDV